MALLIICPVRALRVLLTTLRARAVMMSPMRIAKKIGPMIHGREDGRADGADGHDSSGGAGGRR